MGILLVNLQIYYTRRGEEQVISKISENDINKGKVSNLPTRPNSIGSYGSTSLTSEKLREKFDELSLLAIDKINEIIEGMSANGATTKTIKFKHGDMEYSLQDIFDSIFSGILSQIMIVGENSTLNTALAYIHSSITTESERSETKDEELQQQIDDIIAEKNNIINEIREAINGAFEGLISYANSLEAEVTA